MPGPGAMERWWIDAQERWLCRLERLNERMRPGRLAPHLRTGQRGERAALFELRRRGYTVVAERWSSPKAPGDLDLVAWHGETLCFVEVKSRTARDATPADSAVDDAKRQTLRRLAGHYVQTFPPGARSSISFRFDVVSVYQLGERIEIELMPEAFPTR